MNLSKGRLETFCDAVMAVVITITLLSIPLPDEPDMQGILELLRNELVYALSFIVVASFWLQHHRALGYIDRIDNRLIGLNLVFLFFLSLIPVFTTWVISNIDHLVPAVGYDIVYLLISLSYMLVFKRIAKISTSPEIEKTRILCEQNPALKPERKGWVRFGITTLAVAALTVLSILLPQISTVLLLGFPVVASIFNIVAEEHERTTRENLICEAEKPASK